MLSEVPLGSQVITAIRQHHERLDGSGYPEALQGIDILPEARILAVADVVEAMSSPRPFRPAWGLEAVLAELHAARGLRFDADVVDACVAVLEERVAWFA
jgi:HD-GYP domain-containing protein (c-di-GMP phosphodiesterase class II)